MLPRRPQSTLAEACSKDCTRSYDAMPGAKSAILAMNVALILLAALLLELRSIASYKR